LRIQEAVSWINATLEPGVALGVGIGIATGAALATNMGSIHCSDYTMIGNPINIAARLQGQAGPGEVLVTDAVFKRIGARFPGTPSAEYLLKGISRPVIGHRLTLPAQNGRVHSRLPKHHDGRACDTRPLPVIAP
jgi:class 3 adenylate cyclase